MSRKGREGREEKEGKRGREGGELNTRDAGEGVGQAKCPGEGRVGEY